MIKRGNYQVLAFPIETQFNRIHQSQHQDDLTFFDSDEPYWIPPKRICLDSQCSTTVPQIQCDLSDLLFDLSHYRIVIDPSKSNPKTLGHTGDLLDHSVWTYRFLINMMSRLPIFQPHFISSIPQSYYPVLQIAGLLHDIGKAGDFKTEYFRKPNHPEQGWRYLFDQQDYLWINGQQVNLRSYLEKHCGLSSKEWDLVGLISALHYDIGDLCSNKTSPEYLVEKLISVIDQSETRFDPQIVFRLVRAVTLADVWAQKSVEPDKPGLVKIPDQEIKSRRESTVDNWEKYGYEIIYPWLIKLDNYIQLVLDEKRIIPLQEEFLIGNVGFYYLSSKATKLIPTLTQCDIMPNQCLTPTLSRSSGTTTNREIYLIDLGNQGNLEQLLLDPESPFHSQTEISPEVCLTVCRKPQVKIRQKILGMIRSLLEYRYTDSESLARPIILSWWNRNIGNKINPQRIEELVNELQFYPRSNWTSDQIRMRLYGLANPNTRLEDFISEYDQPIMSKSVQNNQRVFLKIVHLFQTFGPRFQIEMLASHDSWESLIGYLSQNDLFTIPILSPQGLIRILHYLNNDSELIYPILGSWESNEIGKLLAYLGTLNYNLFGDKYDIQGWVVNQGYHENTPLITLIQPDKIGL